MHELGDTVSMSLPQPPHAIQSAVVSAAHSHGIIAVGHAFSHKGAMDLLNAGVDGLTHVFMDEAPDDTWIETMKRTGAHLNPTLSLCASQTGEDQELQRRFVDDELAKRMLSDKEPRESIGLARHAHEVGKAGLKNAIESTKKAYKAGIPIVVGSDAAGQKIGSPYGLGVHMEIYRLVKDVGMSVEEALGAAMGVTAGRFGFKDRGVVEKGRKGDLVLLGGDVRRPTRGVGAVWMLKGFGGRVYLQRGGDSGAVAYGPACTHALHHAALTQGLCPAAHTQVQAPAHYNSTYA